MKHFLLVYDRREGKLINEEVFDLGRDALDRRFELELIFESRRDIEVVVLSSPSREALLSTHARYFRSLGELASG